MSKEELLEKIMQNQFYAVELNLYLDNFPDNKKATEDFEAVSSNLNCLMCKYENLYGPLTNLGSAFVTNPKAWTDTPWPWENR